MIGTHFYNETIRSTVAIFGSLFNNIVIKRNDGKVLPVPIAYGPRSRWLEAQKHHNRDNEVFENYLPRMSYEMVAMNYDANRKLTNKQSMIRIPDMRTAPRERLQIPVPYNVDFTLYIEAKNLTDGFQIIEQILPFFQPAYTVQVKHFPIDASEETPLPENTYDMPITLTAVTWADDYTGEVADRRAVEFSLEFSTKIYLHGPVGNTKIIYDSRAIGAIPVGDVQNANRSTPQAGFEVGYVAAESEIITGYQDLSSSYSGSISYATFVIANVNHDSERDVRQYLLDNNGGRAITEIIEDSETTMVYESDQVRMVLTNQPDINNGQWSYDFQRILTKTINEAKEDFRNSADLNFSFEEFYDSDGTLVKVCRPIDR